MYKTQSTQRARPILIAIGFMLSIGLSQSAWADLPPSVCIMINSDDCVNFESLDPNPAVRGDLDGGKLRIRGQDSQKSDSEKSSDDQKDRLKAKKPDKK